MTVCFMFQKEHRQELSKQSEKNTMKDLIACCGLNGVPITPDMINCLGCPTVGAVWNSNSEAKSRLPERDR